MNRTPFFLALMVLSACDRAVPTDGGVDGGASDVPLDSTLPLDAAATDGGSIDASRDVGARDGGRDAPVDVPVDAGPDVRREVTDALDLFCDPPTYGSCTAPWTCGCDTFGSAPPSDVETCVTRSRSTCDTDLRAQLTPFFARGGVMIDNARVDACVAELRRLFDLCLPPADATELPQPCRDAIVLGLPLGGVCEFPGIRCADGAGVCDRVCEVAPALGESCTSFCGPDLACVSGTCATPVAPGGACSDHEDCAAPELCVGGVCGAPTLSGGSCTDEARCATGLVCDRGVCGPRFAPSCTIGGSDCGAASTCGFATRRVCVLAHATGESCQGDEECQAGNVCDFSISFPGICAPIPSSIGETCSNRCQAGLRCLDTFTGVATCQLPRGNGESCTDVFSRDGFVCDDGLSCNSSGVCATAPGAGELCGGDGICQAGLACLFDDVTFEQRCAPRVPEGASCRGDQECLEDFFCDFSTSFPGVCRPVPREGQLCTFQCAGDLDCRFFAPLGESYCINPGSVGAECTSRCAEGAFCVDDSTMGACRAQVCDSVSAGRPGPIPF